MGYTLCILGCGTMGIAITSGVIASLDARSAQLALEKNSKGSDNAAGSTTPMTAQMLLANETSLPSKFIACVNREVSARRLKDIFRPLGESAQLVEVMAGKNLQALQESDVVLLCCKPQLAQAILTAEGVPQAIQGKLLISILAGVTISQLREWVPPNTRVIRAMPNTPCKIREGMTVVSTASTENSSDSKIIQAIFSSIGRCRFMDEKHFDACTALSGSGPAFICLVLEAMADGGVMMGLPRAEALELAAQTLQGTARMALQSGAHPAQIKDSVTTPGGCTIAGLLTMEDGRVRSTLARTIQVATQRACELGQPSKQKDTDTDYRSRGLRSGTQTPYAVDDRDLLEIPRMQ